jgi:aldehyde dehydrogenase (NAD+)
MTHTLKHYIDGAWVDPIEPRTIEVINPATEEAYVSIAAGSAADVDRAVKAARAAFPTWTKSTREERLTLLRRVLDI